MISRGPNAHCSRAFLRGENLTGGHWTARTVIQQESTFWRRSLWERAGGVLNEKYDLAGDFELWSRFAELAEIYSVQIPLAGFRFHAAQKTANQQSRYFEQAADVLKQRGHLPGPWKGRLAQRILASRWSVMQCLKPMVYTKLQRQLIEYESNHKTWQLKTTTY